MGRLSALAFAALVAAGCDDAQGPLPPPPTERRSEVVVAKETATAATTTVRPAPAGPPRQLCTGKQPARSAPTGALKTAAAADAPALPASPSFGVGKWVWVNFWAAWCGPCKEEIPRLIAWQKKLSTSGTLIDLAFVSLDDDERQMRRFLDAQPQGGVRASYWLPEGERGSWLGAFGLKDSPQLPVQALVAPSGQVACVIEGAVEDRDYPAVAAFVGAKR